MKNRFLQLHILTAYPPSNLNRDDLGRPKTAVVGGVNRLRISSQCLKRTWRASEVFQKKLEGAIGTRTKLLGEDIYQKFLENGIKESDAKTWAESIVGEFGKVGEEKIKAEDKEKEKAKKEKKTKKVALKQLVHFSPQEESAIKELVEKIIARKSAPTTDELNGLQKKEIKAADIAMFGRMLADSAEYNMEAAVQVAHAITTHRVAVEDDFFSAVDELNQKEDTGSAHLGVHEFASGLFYSYVCINRELLKENLQNDEELAKKAIEAFMEASTSTTPSGKQNSFASPTRAAYVLAELGNQQPRSLSNAFFNAIRVIEDGEDLLKKSIDSLNKTKENIDRVYGPSSDTFKVLNIFSKESDSLGDLIEFSIGS